MKEALKEFYNWLYKSLDDYNGSPEEQSAIQQVINKFEELDLDQ